MKARVHRYSITGIESYPYMGVKALLSDSSAPVVMACSGLHLNPHLRGCMGSSVHAHDVQPHSELGAARWRSEVAFMRLSRLFLAHV